MDNIFIGGSYLKRIQNRLVANNFLYFFLTNVQYLYLETNRLEKINQRNEFFLNFRKNLTPNSKIYLSLTGNSLFKNQSYHNHCNPTSRSAFDESKLDRYYDDMKKLIVYIIEQFGNIGVSGKDLNGRIIILPTLPRFIFKCCKDKGHFQQDHKFIIDKINAIQTQLAQTFTIQQTPILKIITNKHMLDYFLTRLNLEDVFARDMDLIKKLAKKNFQFSFKNICTNKKVQRVIFNYILDSSDNRLHLKAKFNHIWSDYLYNITQKDFKPNKVLTPQLEHFYNQLK